MAVSLSPVAPVAPAAPGAHVTQGVPAQTAAAASVVAVLLPVAACVSKGCPVDPEAVRAVLRLAAAASNDQIAQVFAAVAVAAYGLTKPGAAAGPQAEQGPKGSVRTPPNGQKPATQGSRPSHFAGPAPDSPVSL